MSRSILSSALLVVALVSSVATSPATEEPAAQAEADPVDFDLSLDEEARFYVRVTMTGDVTDNNVVLSFAGDATAVDEAAVLHYGFEWDGQEVPYESDTAITADGGGFTLLLSALGDSCGAPDLDRPDGDVDGSTCVVELEAVVSVVGGGDVVGSASVSAVAWEQDGARPIELSVEME